LRELVVEVGARGQKSRSRRSVGPYDAFRLSSALLRSHII
jgi:hypothetical protein